jgi:ABC-type Fe3+/spermidine/putrescine transport system ATPase subunit
VLLETLVGVNRPTGGSVWIDGDDVTRTAPEHRGIGFVYQQSMLFPHLSVRSNITYGMRYHGVPRSDYDERVGRLADLLGIEELLGRSVDALSGGERQKVALARALAIEPRVLLLDEPLAALDPVGKETLRAELVDLHAQTGTTILHVTHDQETARLLGRSIGVMSRGRLLQFGPKDDVFDRPQSAFVAEFVGTQNVFQGTAAEGGLVELSCGTVVTESDLTGSVGLCVRPEWIALEPGHVAAYDNCIHGTVEAISDRGPLVRYDVRTVGEVFVVLQTKKDYGEHRYGVSDAVSMTFEPSAVHVFKWTGR